MKVSNKFAGIVLGLFFMTTLIVGNLESGGSLDARAGAIKNWVTGEVIRAQDLNANFNHIHNSMVGGHGARLVDSDVSSTANISGTKLANAGGIAKAWGRYSCSSGGCTTLESLNLPTSARTGAGVYTLTFSTARPDSNYAIVCTCDSGSNLSCKTGSAGTTSFVATCFSDTGVATDSFFSAVVLDLGAF